MNNDLISRSELKKAIEQGEGFSWDSLGKDDLCVRKKYIDTAPTVEQKEFEQILQPIKVNIPEDIKDRLIEELSKPRKVILDESKTVTDCIIAYGDGFESARRLFERPQGEWIRKPTEHRVDIICTNCGYDDGYMCFKFCPNCGADMRKGEDND